MKIVRNNRNRNLRNSSKNGIDLVDEAISIVTGTLVQSHYEIFISPVITKG